MTRIMHNLKLLLIAVVLSLSCVYIIKHPELFVSSILNLQEIQEVETKQWDIAYKTDNQILDIFLPLTWTHQGQIDLTIAYDDSKISMDFSKAVSQKPYTLTNQQSWSFTLHFVEVSSIDPHQSLFYVPFSWDSQAPLIEDAKSIVDNKQAWLSIWKLSPTIIHWN